MVGMEGEQGRGQAPGGDSQRVHLKDPYTTP